nr:hypothetical protein [Tanacetum cinerariifolium]
MKKRPFAKYSFYQQLNVEEKRQIDKLFRIAQSRRRKCMYPGCGEVAIGSHILQKKGILDKIAEEGHVMQLTQGTPYHPMRFERRGIGTADMLVFSGFCSINKHDAQVFDEIENQPCDFTTYRQQLLSSYRGHLNELAKQYFLVDFHTAVIADPIFRDEVKR